MTCSRHVLALDKVSESTTLCCHGATMPPCCLQRFRHTATAEKGVTRVVVQATTLHQTL